MTTLTAPCDRFVPSGKTGGARMKELGAENRAATDKLAADLTAGLNRPATAAEAVEAELIAATMIRSRRLRERGRDDRSERRQLERLLPHSIFGTLTAPSPAQIQQGRAAHDAVEAMFQNHPGRRWAIEND